MLLSLRDSVVRLHRDLGLFGIGGGAVHDSLVGLAARDHGVPLATRDERARGTYALLGVVTIVVGVLVTVLSPAPMLALEATELLLAVRTILQF